MVLLHTLQNNGIHQRSIYKIKFWSDGLYKGYTREGRLLDGITDETWEQMMDTIPFAAYYSIERDSDTKLWYGVIRVVNEYGWHVESYYPTANHYYADKNEAENYVLQRLRHFRLSTPVKFLGRIDFNPYENIQIDLYKPLYTLPKQK